jgi:hypothetical protein
VEEQNNAAPGARRRPPSDDPFTVLSRNTNLGKALESSRLGGPACGARQTRKRGKDSKRRRTPAPRAPQSTISRWTVYCSGAVLGPSRATFRAWHGAPTPLFRVPISLRSALLIQAGEAIIGNRHFRRCKNYTVWFQVGSGANTPRREFRQDKCHVAGARRHKRERDTSVSEPKDSPTGHIGERSTGVESVRRSRK